MMFIIKVVNVLALVYAIDLEENVSAVEVLRVLHAKR
jgi:hypothetical protein